MIDNRNIQKYSNFVFRSPTPWYVVEMEASLDEVVVMATVVVRSFVRLVVVGNCTERSVTVLHDASPQKHTPSLPVSLTSRNGSKKTCHKRLTLTLLFYHITRLKIKYFAHMRFKRTSTPLYCKLLKLYLPLIISCQLEQICRTMILFRR